MTPLREEKEKVAPLLDYQAESLVVAAAVDDDDHTLMVVVLVTNEALEGSAENASPSIYYHNDWRKQQNGCSNGCS